MGVLVEETAKSSASCLLVNSSNSAVGQHVCSHNELASYICWNNMVWQCVSMFVSDWPGGPVNFQSLERIPFATKCTPFLGIIIFLVCLFVFCLFFGWHFSSITIGVKTGHSPSTMKTYLSYTGYTCWQATNSDYGWLFYLHIKFTGDSFVAAAWI